MTDRLDGRVAVITGGSSGLGRAGANRFSAAGAKVAIGSPQPAEGAEVAAEITARRRRSFPPRHRRPQAR